MTPPETPRPLDAWRSFKELDAALGRPKGSAFRAFKRLEPQWTEGREFIVLQPGRDDAALAELRGSGRIYASTVKAVLLSAPAAQRLLATST